jgi:putative transposase
VCARAKAVEAIKAVKAKHRETCPQFGPRGSVRYAARTYRLMSLDRVSLTTLEGRVVCRLVRGARCAVHVSMTCWLILLGRLAGPI